MRSCFRNFTARKTHRERLATYSIRDEEFLFGNQTLEEKNCILLELPVSTCSDVSMRRCNPLSIQTHNVTGRTLLLLA